jgi:flagellar basal body-associated protein FliL
MEIVTILTVLVIILIVALVFVVFYLGSRNGNDTGTKVLQNSLGHLFDAMREMEHKVLNNEREMGKKTELQFQESQKLISQITEKLTEVKEGNKQVLTMTEQLANLEKVLTNQKQTWELGRVIT